MVNIQGTEDAIRDLEKLDKPVVQRVLKKITWLSDNISLPALLFIITFAVYSSALTNGFVWDDKGFILANPLIKNWKNIPQIFFSPFSIPDPGEADTSYYRPIIFLSFLLDYSIWDMNPFGYHLSSILIHGINVLLLYCVSLILFRKRWPALFISLLFAVHPVHAESVAVIHNRHDILCALFFLISFLLFICYRTTGSKSRGYLIFSLISCFVALLSKEMALSFPLIIILYDLTFRPSSTESGIGASLKTYSLFLVVIAGYLFLRQQVLGTFIGPGSILEGLFPKMLTMTTVLISYLRLLFFPTGLQGYYIIPLKNSILDPEVLLALTLLGLIILGLIMAFRTHKTLFFAGSWFFLTLLPVSQIYPITNPFMAEHFLYLPSVGFCIFLTRAIVSIFETTNLSFLGRQFLKALALLPIIFVSVLTIQRNKVWKDDFTLFFHLVKIYPSSRIVQLNLGNAYFQKGDYDEAITAYKAALAINPDYAKTHFNLGMAYLQKGLTEPAISEFKTAIKTNPKYVNAYQVLGDLYRHRGMWGEAINVYQKALALAPSYALHTNLGIAYAQKGWMEKAIIEFETALKLNPKDPGAYYNLGKAYQTLGQQEEAHRLFDEALKLNPKSLSIKHHK